MIEYENPIIYADYSDPDPIRVGDDYYLVASSFTYLPGVPILHSRDLVHWELINYAVRELPFEKYSNPSHGSGTWAPSIRYHNGEFFIFIPLVDEGILVARSHDIRGEFKLNMLVSAKGWIDPCPLWDSDGRAYMVFAFAESRIGIKHKLALIEIDSECTHTIGDWKVIFDGTTIAPVSEGPKAYFVDGWYYILFPAGGVAPGWQCAIRSRSIHGPYEYKVIMHQGKSAINGPHQGGLVDTPSGSLWFINFQDVGELGRILHLQPVSMIDGWPMIGSDIDGDGIGEPVRIWKIPLEEHPLSLSDSDEFDASTLSLQWQWQANPSKSWFSFDRKSFISLRCIANDKRENLLWYAPNAMTEIPHRDSFTLDAYLELKASERGDAAYLALLGHLYGMIGLEYDGKSFALKAIKGRVTGKTFEGKAEEVEVYSVQSPSSSVYLRAEVRKNKDYFLSYSFDGKEYQTVPYIFHLERATWTGAKIVLWAANRENRASDGAGCFDYIRST